MAGRGRAEEDAVARAMRAVPRRHFLRGSERAWAHRDAPLQIGAGQTCSQPRTVTNMLRLLDVRPGQRVLDVGSGSGWTTALLAYLVGRGGGVVGVELEPGLARRGAGNVDAFGLPWALVRTADPDELGWPDGAPYARVLVSANADELPQALVAQLAVDGLMVVPVASRLLRVRRLPDETVEVTDHGAYRFVPLR